MFGSVIIIIVVLFIAIAAMLGINKRFVPTPQDEAMRLEASATKTANFNGTAFDFGAGFAPGGPGLPMAAVLNITAADRADSNETYTFVLEESSDNSTFTAAGPAITVEVSGASATTGVYSAVGFVSQRYVRCRLTVAGTTPSVTYEAWLNPNISMQG